MSAKAKKEFENAVKSFESAKSWKVYFSNQLKSKEWFESITGFVRYLILIYGELSNYLNGGSGYIGYLETVTEHVENAENDISREKREKLLTFLEEYNLEVNHKIEMRCFAIYLPCKIMIDDFLDGLKVFKGDYSKDPDTRNFEIATENRLIELENSIIEFLTFRNNLLVDVPEVFGDLERLENGIVRLVQGGSFKRLDKSIKAALENNPSKENLSTQSIQARKETKDLLWFKVGVLFANGEIPIERKDLKISAIQLAKGLGNKSYRPFISTSQSDAVNGNKQIFIKKRVTQILAHCENENIKVCKDFKSKCKSLNLIE